MVGSDVAEKLVQLLSLRAEHIGYEGIDSGPPHRRKVKAHDLKDPPRSRLPGIGDPLGPGGVPMAPTRKVPWWKMAREFSTGRPTPAAPIITAPSSSFKCQQP